MSTSEIPVDVEPLREEWPAELTASTSLRGTASLFAIAARAPPSSTMG